MKRTLTILLTISFAVTSLTAQTKKTKLTLEQVIDLALSQSLDMYVAKNRLKGSYWEFRSYKAEFRPSLNFNSTVPSYNRSLVRQKLPNDQGILEENFYETNSLYTSAGLSVNQNIPLTGGSVFASTSLSRSDNFDDNAKDKTIYNSAPVRLGFTQPLAAFNRFKWLKKIEPLKYEMAKKKYVKDIENISHRASGYFFDMALAQIKVAMNEANLRNNDTLNKIAKGRFQMGKISKNELLQMELNALNSKSSLKQAQIEYETAKFRLRSYLGYNENVDLELIINDSVPTFKIEDSQAVEFANQNNPDILEYNKQLIEADREVAQAKAGRFFSAELTGSIGLTQKGKSYSDVYKKPNEQVGVEIGIKIPIVDWGLRKGKHFMAKSRREVTRTNIKQSKIDFNQNIKLQVNKFNNQESQLAIAKKANEIAQSKYDITKKRFLIGKITVLELDKAISEKDKAKESRIDALRNYWNYYFTMRKLTLYDFLKDKSLLDIDMRVEDMIN